LIFIDHDVLTQSEKFLLRCIFFDIIQFTKKNLDISFSSRDIQASLNWNILWATIRHAWTWCRTRPCL